MNPPLWQWLVRRRIFVANIGLVVVLAVGCVYLAANVLRFNPIPHTYTVTVMMASSGGLVEGNDVSFRGAPVGRVAQIRVEGDGVAAVAEIEDTVKIPEGGTVSVGRLSAAGEQFLDFRPDADSGPYLLDGAVVDRTRTTTPVQMQSVLSNLAGFIGGMNPDRLTVIVDELDKALAGGPDKLRNMISGLSRAMSGLTDLLPQTRQLLENLMVIGETTSHAQPDLGTITAAGTALFAQFTAADAELRSLLTNGPGHLSTIDGFISETQDPITNLVTNFVAITKAAKLRAPAIAALFPALRAGSEAVGIPAHDGAYHTLVDPWPRPWCEYETIPVAPAEVQVDTRVRLYNYCVTSNPALQVRGSANAPRPNVPDNGADIPDGADPNALSQPVPAR
ncbi:MCE family protein [Nocardia sp. NPDC055321]